MRRPNVLRPITLNTTLPEDLRAKLDLHLYSGVESRIPKGAYQKLIIQLLTEFFNRRPPKYWIIAYEDAEIPIEVFTGEGAEAAARTRYAQAKDSFTCHLFASVEN
jgi:hypothetical protein